MSLKKTATIKHPHAIYRSPLSDWEWRVLRTYKKPESERKDPYARWLLAVKSPHTFGEFEIGDTYIRAMKTYARLVACTDEFRAAYNVPESVETLTDEIA